MRSSAPLVHSLSVCMPRFALFFCASFLFAQQPPDGFHVQTRESQLSSDEIIHDFEAPQMEAYSLEPGDEISLDVWGHADLSARHVLGPDGKITVPVVGTINLNGLTRDQAEKRISESLGRFYTDLSVTLSVDKYSSFRVYVLGRVSNPGALQFESQPTLLDVLTRAGALPINAEKSTLGRCAIVRGRDQMIWVDLKSLLGGGNLSLNIRLARNDLVYIPDANDQSVYVLGQVVHPGAFHLTARMSFLDAFTQAGGATPDAENDKVLLVRGDSSNTRQVRLKDLLADPRELNFALKEGDVIYVPEKGLSKLGYVFQKLSPVTGLALIGTVFK